MLFFKLIAPQTVLLSYMSLLRKAQKNLDVSIWRHTFEQIITKFDCFHSLTLNYMKTAVPVYKFP